MPFLLFQDRQDSNDVKSTSAYCQHVLSDQAGISQYGVGLREDELRGVERRLKQVYCFHSNQESLIIFKENAQWQAVVSERIGHFSRTAVFPVFCNKKEDVESTLIELDQSSAEDLLKKRIHVMWKRNFVFLGWLGLKGGCNAPSENTQYSDYVIEDSESSPAEVPLSGNRRSHATSNLSRVSLDSWLESSAPEAAEYDSDIESDHDCEASGGTAGRFAFKTHPSRNPNLEILRRQLYRRDSRKIPLLVTASSQANQVSIAETAAQSACISHVDSIAELVKRLNSCERDSEQQILLDLADECVDSFAKSTVECLDASDIRDYFSFVRLEAKDGKTTSFVLRWFYSVANKVCGHRLGETALLEELECSLHLMDVRIFQGDPSSLIKLCDHLLEKLDDSRSIFSKSTYPTHCHTLHAIRQVLAIIHTVSPAEWNPNHLQGPYQRFKTQLKRIIQHCDHYPTIFLARVLKESLKQMQASGFDARRQDIQRRIFSAFSGTAYFAVVLRNMATLEFDPENFERGCEHWHDALTTKIDADLKQWYKHYQVLNLASLQVLQDASKYAEFTESLRVVKQVLASQTLFRNQKELRFGVISLIVQLILNSPSNEVRKKSLKKLLKLKDQWYEDADVLGGVLDVLLSNVFRGNASESAKANNALKRWNTIRVNGPKSAANLFGRLRKWMNPAQRKLRRLKTAIDAWLDGKSLSEVLFDHPRIDRTQQSCRFFRSVKRELLQTPAFSCADYSRGTKTGLQATLFAPPLVEFFEGRSKEIDALKAAFQSEQELIIAPPIVGQRGSGKSQLAIKVFQEQRQTRKYEHAFWIPASSPSSLTDAYMKIARLFGVQPCETDTEQTIAVVRALLSERFCLYVFDNAKSLSAIRDFLPRDKGHVLITSLEGSPSSWYTEPRPLVLSPLDVEEAFALSLRFGFAGDTCEKDGLRAVLTKSPRFPLSLCQIFSALQLEGHGPCEWIQFIEQLVSSLPSQLAKELEQAPQDRIRYDQGNIRVVHRTLSALDEACSAENVPALRVLAQLAYCDTSAVPLQWMLLWDSEDLTLRKQRARQALTLLEKYSLIQWDRESGNVYVHAETQLAVRCSTQGMTDLSTLVKSLPEYVGDLDAQHENYHKWLLSLPHARALYRALSESQSNSASLQQQLTNHLTLGCHVVSLFRESVEWADKQLELTRESRADDHADIVRALSDLALSLDEYGEHLKAWNLWKAASLMARRLHEKTPSMTLVMALIEFGSSSHRLHYNQEALDSFEEARKLVYEVSGEMDPCVSLRIINNMANCYAELNLKTEALQLRKQAVRKAKEIYENKTCPVVVSCLSNLGTTLATLGKREEAFLLLKSALQKNDSLHQGRPNSDLVLVLRNLSWIAAKLGRKEQALDYSDRALQLSRQLHFDQDHIDVARSLTRHANNLSKSGLHDEGLEVAGQAVDVSRRIFQSQDHPVLLRSLGTLGMIYHRKGNASLAKTYLKDALFMAIRVYGDPEHKTVVYYNRFVQDHYQNDRRNSLLDRYLQPQSSSQHSRREISSVGHSSTEIACCNVKADPSESTEGKSDVQLHKQGSKMSEQNGSSEDKCLHEDFTTLQSISDYASPDRCSGVLPCQPNRTAEIHRTATKQGGLFRRWGKIFCFFCGQSEKRGRSGDAASVSKRETNTAANRESLWDTQCSSPSDASHWTFDSRRMPREKRLSLPSLSETA